MSQLSERMASAGMPMLMEMDGEPVTYNRVVNGSAASGFPKSIEVLFRIEDKSRKEYAGDGRGDMTSAVAHILLTDVGSTIQIGVDTITRADNTVWLIEEIDEISAGIAICSLARYEMVESSLGDYRIKR